MSNQEVLVQAVQSNALRLIQPGNVQEVVLEHKLSDGFVVIEPSLGSICHADLRYYTGQRRPEALARKLPMALIHEGIGTVVASADPSLRAEDKVVIVPNIPGYLLSGTHSADCCPACRGEITDNYCYHGRFLGSGYDGIAQSRLVIPAACAIPVPSEVPDEIAVLAELCSVSCQALSRVKHLLQHAETAVFGDGPVGYVTASMLHHMFGLESDRLRVFGAMSEKLDKFTFAERAMVQTYDFQASSGVDIAVECTGGKFSESAVNQAIDLLKPGGYLILMGVTEERVPINTRDVLEKGITLIGSSRSSAADFTQVLQTMRSVDCQNTLRQLLSEQTCHVAGAADFTEAMDNAARHRDWQKKVLAFQWPDTKETNPVPQNNPDKVK